MNGAGGRRGNSCWGAWLLMLLVMHLRCLIVGTNAFIPHQSVLSYLIPSAYSQRSSVLWMGKGDGKKKRKKKKSSPAASSSGSPLPLSSEPLRVTSDSNISVRKQLMWAKLNKEYRRQQSPGFRQNNKKSAPVKRTSYRRTWHQEEILRKAEERARKGQEPNWDVILNQTAYSPLVLVDGYNIIHSWARLKKHMTKGDPSRARELLIEDLEVLRQFKGWRIEAVFDGTSRRTKGPLATRTTSSSSVAETRVSSMDQSNRVTVSKHGIRVVYSGVGSEADTYIESRLEQARNVTEGTTTAAIMVATDDGLIRTTAQRCGALCLGANRLVTELKALRQTTSERVEVAVARANGHAVRPEALRQSSVLQQFGRRSVLIEDKRNRTNARLERREALRQQLAEVSNTTVSDCVRTEIPWWAQVPNQTISKDRRGRYG